MHGGEAEEGQQCEGVASSPSCAPRWRTNMRRIPSIPRPRSKPLGLAAPSSAECSDLLLLKSSIASPLPSLARRLLTDSCGVERFGTNSTDLFARKSCRTCTRVPCLTCCLIWRLLNAQLAASSLVLWSAWQGCAVERRARAAQARSWGGKWESGNRFRGIPAKFKPTMLAET